MDFIFLWILLNVFNFELVYNIDFCFLGYEFIVVIMTLRFKNFSVVVRYWGDGDIKVSIILLYLFYKMRKSELF